MPHCGQSLRGADSHGILRPVLQHSAAESAHRYVQVIWLVFVEINVSMLKMPSCATLSSQFVSFF